MPPFTSEQFHAITRANPECFWNALTATGVPLDYLHEMTADTDWQPGVTISGRPEEPSKPTVSPPISLVTRKCSLPIPSVMSAPPLIRDTASLGLTIQYAVSM
jgi:hypothetical protein